MEEVLRAGRDGLTPKGIDSAIEIVSTVSEAAQKGEYDMEDISRAAGSTQFVPGPVLLRPTVKWPSNGPVAECRRSASCADESFKTPVGADGMP